MLDLMRKKKESIIIKAVFIVIVLSFIGTIFLVWGKGEDGFSRGGGDYAAKVDRTKISFAQYENSYNNLRSIYQQVFGQAGGLTPELEKQLNLRQQALDRLIDSVLLTKGAKGLGVSVSKDEVAAAIAAMPAFQRNGQFDLGIYQQTLKMMRITANDFEESQKSDLLILKTRKAIMDKTQVTDDEIKAQYHKERDKVELIYSSFAPGDLAAEVKLNDAELEEHLKKNSDKFKTPVKAAISYLVLDPSPLVAGQSVSDDELERHFKQRQERWLGKELKEVREQVLADAKRNKAAKALYEKMADTLFQNEKSGDLALIAGKLQARVNETQLFTQAAPPQALAGETALLARIFETKQGALTGPLETAKGIYIVKVKEKKDAELLPLAQVRATVEQQVRAVKAAELAKTKAIAAQKQLVGTDHGGLKLQATPLFGYNAKGELPGIGASLPLMEAVFKLSAVTAAPSEPFAVGNRWYAVRLKTHDIASEKDLAAQKEAIKAKLLPGKQESALTGWLKERRAAAKIVINPALSAAQ